MSLHARIVGWFAIFATAAVLAVGLGDYIQTLRGLRLTLESRIGSVALRAAAETERRYQAHRAELIAGAWAASLGFPDAFSPAVQARYSSLVVRSRGRTVLAIRRPSSQTVDYDSCGSPTVDLAFSSVGLAGEPIEITASMPATTFFSELGATVGRVGNRGITAAVRSGDGTLIRDFGCQAGVTGYPASILRRRLAAARLVRQEIDGVRLYTLPTDSRYPLLAAVAPVAGPEWGLWVAVDQGEFASPFLGARLWYVGLVGAIIFAALLFVLHGIRNDLGRLSAIASAADEIGRGRFDVWLPPPTGDEVGRVSLALGRMVDRLSASIRQIEITRSMAAVGELSTYLSHEIRNPLSSVQLNLQMLRRDLRSGAVPDDVGELVDLSLTELSRLEGVVRAVLQLGREPLGPSQGCCLLNQTIRDTVKVVQRTLDERGITLELQLPEVDVMAGMDGAVLRSVLLNLLLNSTDAMAEQADRRITIRASTVAGDGLPAGVAIAVRDVGPGVSPHLRERIFDPFFTTKPNGNGIGLSIALRAVQECGGVLRYAPPAEGVGAEFIVELPICVESGPQPVPATIPPPGTEARRVTPLVPTGA